MKNSSVLTLLLISLAALVACTHTVKMEAPKDPIVINMNINISHEVRVKVDRELDSLLEKNNAIF